MTSPLRTSNRKRSRPVYLQAWPFETGSGLSHLDDETEIDSPSNVQHIKTQISKKPPAAVKKSKTSTSSSPSKKQFLKGHPTVHKSATHFKEVPKNDSDSEDDKPLSVVQTSPGKSTTKSVAGETSDHSEVGENKPAEDAALLSAVSDCSDPYLAEIIKESELDIDTAKVINDIQNDFNESLFDNEADNKSDDRPKQESESEFDSSNKNISNENDSSISLHTTEETTVKGESSNTGLPESDVPTAKREGMVTRGKLGGLKREVLQKLGKSVAKKSRVDTKSIISEETAAPEKKEKEESSDDRADSSDSDESDSSSSSGSDDEWSDDPDTLYCVCRQKYDKRFMICCDDCGEWYHGDCIGITLEMGRKMEQNDEQYSCPACSEKDSANSKPKVVKAEKKPREAKEESYDYDPSFSAPGDKSSDEESDFGESMDHIISEMETEKTQQPELGRIKKKTPEKKPASDSNEKVDAKKKRRMIKTPKRKHKEHEETAPPSLTIKHCIASSCQNWAQKESIFCSDKCIAAHAEESLKLLKLAKMKQLPPGVKQPVTPGEKERIMVTERHTGRLIMGGNAPHEQNLVKWLRKHPTFEVLRPGQALAHSTGLSAASKFRPIESALTTDKTTESANSGPDQVRLNVRKALWDQLVSRVNEAKDITQSSAEVKKIALSIEDSLFKYFGNSGVKYKNRYRSLLFNIKDTKNQGFFRKILNGSLKPFRLVRMSPEQMASKEMADWRQKEIRHNLEKSHREEMIVTKSRLAPEMSSKDLINDWLGKERSTSPNITGLLMADTTAQHGSHLFNQNCKICTGEQVAPPAKKSGKSHPSSQRKKTAKLPSRATENFPAESNNYHSDSIQFSPGNQEASLNTDVPSFYKESFHYNPSEKSVDDTSVVHTVIETQPEVEKSTQPELNLAIRVDSTDSSPPSTPESPGPLSPLRARQYPAPRPPGVIWDGTVNMTDTAQFHGIGYLVSGSNSDFLQAELPDVMSICGRIPPAAMWGYIGKLKGVTEREVMVMRIHAVSEEENVAYLKLYQYLLGRNRCAVVQCTKPNIKDLYLVPLPNDIDIPEPLLPCNGPGFEAVRPHMLILVIVRVISREEYSSLVYSENPIPQPWDKKHAQPVVAPLSSTTTSVMPNEASSINPPDDEEYDPEDVPIKLRSSDLPPEHSIAKLHTPLPPGTLPISASGLLSRDGANDESKPVMTQVTEILGKLKDGAKKDSKVLADLMPLIQVIVQEKHKSTQQKLLRVLKKRVNEYRRESDKAVKQKAKAEQVTKLVGQLLAGFNVVSQATAASASTTVSSSSTVGSTLSTSASSSSSAVSSADVVSSSVSSVSSVSSSTVTEPVSSKANFYSDTLSTATDKPYVTDSLKPDTSKEQPALILKDHRLISVKNESESLKVSAPKIPEPLANILKNMQTDTPVIPTVSTTLPEHKLTVSTTLPAHPDTEQKSSFSPTDTPASPPPEPAATNDKLVQPLEKVGREPGEIDDVDMEVIDPDEIDNLLEKDVSHDSKVGKSKKKVDSSVKPTGVVINTVGEQQFAAPKPLFDAYRVANDNRFSKAPLFDAYGTGDATIDDPVVNTSSISEASAAAEPDYSLPQSAPAPANTKSPKKRIFGLKEGEEESQDKNPVLFSFEDTDERKNMVIPPDRPRRRPEGSVIPEHLFSQLRKRLDVSHAEGLLGALSQKYPSHLSIGELRQQLWSSDRMAVDAAVLDVLRSKVLLKAETMKEDQFSISTSDLNQSSDSILSEASSSNDPRRSRKSRWSEHSAPESDDLGPDNISLYGPRRTLLPLPDSTESTEIDNSTESAEQWESYTADDEEGPTSNQDMPHTEAYEYHADDWSYQQQDAYGEFGPRFRHFDYQHRPDNRYQRRPFAPRGFKRSGARFESRGRRFDRFDDRSDRGRHKRDDTRRFRFDYDQQQTDTRKWKFDDQDQSEQGNDASQHYERDSSDFGYRGRSRGFRRPFRGRGFRRFNRFRGQF